MQEFLLNIVEITAGMSLLILVMLVILQGIGGKFTAKCRYILWTLVLVRLVIPCSLGILPALIEVPIGSEPVQIQQMQTPAADTLPPVTQTPVTVQPQEPVQIPVHPVETPAAPEPEPVTWEDIAAYIPYVYLTGAAVFLFWNLLSYVLCTAKILRSAKQADRDTMAVYESVCRKHALRRIPELLISPDVNSPAAFGIFRRRIVLPEIAFPENGLEGTLSHEVIHCRRGDLYGKLLALLARSLHWFNPLVHLAAFRCEMEMELSCDEAVLAGCDENTRAAYGEVMLDIIKRCRRNRGALTTHFNPHKNAVKARFANILYGSGKKRGLWLIAVCVVLCVLAGTMFGQPKLTLDNIETQKGFTILSQETAELTLTLPAEQLPTYDDIVSAEGVHLELEDIPVFTTDTTEVFLHTIGISEHSPEGVEKDILYLGFDIRHDLPESGTIYTVNRVMNESGSHTYTSAFHVTESTLQRYDRGIRWMGNGPADQFHLYVDAALYTTLQGEVQIGITLNEIEYARGKEVKIYGRENSESAADSSGMESQNQNIYADLAEQMKQLDNQHADLAASQKTLQTEIATLTTEREKLSAQLDEMSENSEEARQLRLVIQEHDEQIKSYQLSLQGIQAEMELLTAQRQTIEGQLQTLADRMNATEAELQEILPETEPDAVTYTSSIYLCDDVYRSETTPTHGKSTITFPDGLNGYKLYSCDILLCADGCDPHDVVWRNFFGYAGGYELQELQLTETCSYPAKLYLMEYPEEIVSQILADMEKGGASEEEKLAYRNRRWYLYLLTLDETHYACIFLEPENMAVRPENEQESLDALIASAEITMTPTDTMRMSNLNRHIVYPADWFHDEIGIFGTAGKNDELPGWDMMFWLDEYRAYTESGIGRVWTLEAVPLANFSETAEYFLTTEGVDVYTQVFSQASCLLGIDTNYAWVLTLPTDVQFLESDPVSRENYDLLQTESQTVLENFMAQNGITPNPACPATAVYTPRAMENDAIAAGSESPVSSALAEIITDNKAAITEEIYSIIREAEKVRYDIRDPELELVSITEDRAYCTFRAHWESIRKAEEDPMLLGMYEALETLTDPQEIAYANDIIEGWIPEIESWYISERLETQIVIRQNTGSWALYFPHVENGEETLFDLAEYAKEHWTEDSEARKQGGADIIHDAIQLYREMNRPEGIWSPYTEIHTVSGKEFTVSFTCPEAWQSESYGILNDESGKRIGERVFRENFSFAEFGQEVSSSDGHSVLENPDHPYQGTTESGLEYVGYHKSVSSGIEDIPDAEVYSFLVQYSDSLFMHISVWQYSTDPYEDFLHTVVLPVLYSVQIVESDSNIEPASQTPLTEAEVLPDP